MICVPEGCDEATLDFNLIIPMPDVLNSTTAGGDAELGIEILTGQPKPCIFGMFEDSYLDFAWVRELGITTIEELRSWAEKEWPTAILEGQKRDRCPPGDRVF